MKPRSKRVLIMTLGFSISFVALLVIGQLAYVQAHERAGVRCLKWAKDSSRVELDALHLSWRCILTDSSGKVSEKVLPLY